MPLTQALYYSTSGAEKTVTFISKYGSRSMDSQTLDYYEKIKQNYNVYIVKDLSVSGNSQDWKTALDDSDLIFLISLSDEVLNETRDDFCKNLATTLNKSVGIAFAGNSVMSKDDFYGCIYTSHFNFAELWKNSELLSNKVTITKLHEMTGDYQKGDYNLGENKTIYPVISPNNGDTLAIVNGDPDGLGARPAADYPLFVLWRGLRYNAVSWGITTSKLSGCSNCLDWKLLYQFLDW
ncbi:MAG: hypothetical protein ISS48_03700, partial [Candidatus Aenigmarchaeota archaeon]|nr:hypothetical protein [Candidatus Aenigmarchaeota archaeon]